MVPTYVFPEMKLCDLVIFRTELLCSFSQFPHSCIWEYINRSQIHEFRNWERGRTVSFLGIDKSDFRYSVEEKYVESPCDWLDEEGQISSQIVHEEQEGGDGNRST